MAKPIPPLFPLIHPSTPVQQLRPMLEAYRTQVETFYEKLVKDYDRATGLVRWATQWEAEELTDEQLRSQLNSPNPSPQALALARKKLNLE